MYRINQLIKLNQNIFHTHDLAIVWGIRNPNTLYTLIKRYVQKGILIPIYKGLYSMLPVDQLHPLVLGKAVIHRYTYLSTESVLAQAGVISQPAYTFTFISDIHKKAVVGPYSFLFRQLKPIHLHHPIGLANHNVVRIASVERAVADLLYYNPRYHFDVMGGVDIDQVKFIQKQIGYPC